MGHVMKVTSAAVFQSDKPLYIISFGIVPHAFTKWKFFQFSPISFVALTDAVSVYKSLVLLLAKRSGKQLMLSLMFYRWLQL